MKTTEKAYEIKYTGCLMDAENMVLHYGYNNWEYVTEKKMRKLKSCYKVEINLPADASEFNFCFRANDNEWDNNCGNNWNYIPGKIVDYGCVEVSEAVKAEKKATAKLATKTMKKVTTSKSTSKK